MTLAVVFDLDDTLYPERSYNLGGFDAVGEYVHEKFGRSDFSRVCRQLYDSGIRGDIFDRANDQLKLQIPVLELIEVYRHHSPRIELFDDAAIVLRQLQGILPLGLITDGYAAVQRRKLKALEITNFFQSIVVSDELGREAWKPSPLPYLQTVMQLGNQANRYVYIGDNPAKDFITARKLGWSTIMIKRPTSVYSNLATPEHAAEHVITDLQEIPWKFLDAPIT